MSLIEEAAKRLGQLRSAGVVVSDANLDAKDKKVRRELYSHASVENIYAGGNEAPPQKNPSKQSSQQIQIDLARLTALGFVTQGAPRSHIADEFRVLKRSLIANASGKSAAPVKAANLIMVTSALPGEGKTFSAVNLALSIAMELDRSVLLVDADVSRPSLPILLGFHGRRGLLDVLRDKSIDLSSVISRTNVDKLSVLPSGTPHESATELLASDAMAKMVDEMATRYSDRIIIVDSPPLLVTTEARVLATLMGQIVFVVKAESTQQSQVIDALSTIENCPIKLMILNQVSTASQGAYGYGYGYGYSS